MPDTTAKSTMFHVLVVDDNPATLRLIQEAFAEANPSARLHLSEGGFDAVAFLRRHGEQAAAPRPHLILLDLVMPGLDGRDVLSEIKGDADLKAIPIVVLTSSELLEDISVCYALKANCYLVKPHSWEGLKDLVTAVSMFWLSSGAPMRWSVPVKRATATQSTGIGAEFTPAELIIRA